MAFGSTVFGGTTFGGSIPTPSGGCEIGIILNSYASVSISLNSYVPDESACSSSGGPTIITSEC